MFMLTQFWSVGSLGRSPFGGGFVFLFFACVFLRRMRVCILEDVLRLRGYRRSPRELRRLFS